MLYGMGTVFTFLALMVFVLFLLAKVVKKFPGPHATENLAVASPAAVQIDPAHLKAIELAVQQLVKKQ